uniref:fructosamine-3-kinase-like n=1 Tax=Macaca mulatta TaxID=9544 RepID=UPI0010A2A5D4|nr:fructosamine-3-kinase-like [Macaca mulatta]
MSGLNLLSVQAQQMFDGEVASLEALRGTGLVQALRSMKVIDLPRGGATFVMEHLKMRSLSRAATRTAAEGTGSAQEHHGPAPSGLLCPS